MDPLDLRTLNHLTITRGEAVAVAALRAAAVGSAGDRGARGRPRGCQHAARTGDEGPATARRPSQDTKPRKPPRLSSHGPVSSRMACRCTTGASVTGLHRMWPSAMHACDSARRRTLPITGGCSSRSRSQRRALAPSITNSIPCSGSRIRAARSERRGRHCRGTPAARRSQQCAEMFHEGVGDP